MKLDTKNDNPQDALRHNTAKRIIDRLATEKKKTVFVVCLITLMVFMWVRVLGEKAPKTAEAAIEQEMVTTVTSESEPQSKVTFIELPKVPGRNTEITRDFFALDDWGRFITAREREMERSSRMTTGREGNDSRK